MDRPMSVIGSPQSGSLPLRFQADLQAFKCSVTLGDSPIFVNSRSPQHVELELRTLVRWIVHSFLDNCESGSSASAPLASIL